MDNHYHLLLETPHANLSKACGSSTGSTPKPSTGAMGA
jgi:hypothetical protein